MACAEAARLGVQGGGGGRGGGGGPGGRRPEVGCGRDGRRRMAVPVISRDATRLLGSTSLRGEAVGSRGASSHARLFWAGMRGESGCAEGARVGARRRRNGASDSRPHRVLRARVVLDRAATWTRLGVRLARDRQRSDRTL
jgi:hypothetical protein